MMDFHVVVGPVVGAVVTAILAWFIGNRVAARWGFWQKRREATLAAQAEFSRLYGEFFINWKRWNYLCEGGEIDRPTLIDKAYSAEADAEALFILLSVQSSLTKDDIEVAGRFRQAYQHLRKTICKNHPPETPPEKKRLAWDSHDHPEYTTFKILSTSFALLLSSMDLKKVPSTLEACNNLAEITHNKWEKWS